MAEIKLYETVNYQNLIDEIDRRIEDDRFKYSEIAIEALESIKW